jgi:hypothetical protein
MRTLIEILVGLVILATALQARWDSVIDARVALQTLDSGARART